MKSSFRYLLSLSVVLIAAAVGLAQSVGSPSIDQQTRLVTELNINGLKVLVKRRVGAPTVAAGLFVRGGVSGATPKTSGLENLTLLTATESSANFPREVMRKELSKMGSSLGASAGFDYSVVSLAATRESFPASWDIFVDSILKPTFNQADLDIVKSRVLTGLRNVTVSPDTYLDSLVDKTIYANRPYAIDPKGTIESVSSFTAADLRVYHAKLLNTSRLLLVVVGDIDPQEFGKKVELAFGQLPRGTFTPSKIPSLSFLKPSLDIVAKPIETNYIKGVFAAPSVGDPDYYAMRVAVAILQGRVYEEVRMKRNLSYAPNADMDDFAANTGHIYVTTNDSNRAVSVMLDEIEKLGNEEVGEEEFLGIPGYFLSTYFVKLETNSAQAGELARYELIGGGWRKSSDFIRGVSAVTPADVQRVARKYMRNLQFVILGNPFDVDRSIFMRL